MAEEAVEGAKEFLLQEYQSLYTLHKEAKAVGETRLDFYVTFVAAVITGLVAIQSFVLPEFRPWLIGGTGTILLVVGLTTYRKMLQRRVAIIIYRRRLSRIRAWFLKYYPLVSSGLPYDTNQNIRMDWGSTSKLGSTAFSVAFINTALVGLTVVTVPLTSSGVGSALWAAPIAVLAAAVSWLLHIVWKNRWMKDAEIRDDKDLLALDKTESQGSTVESVKS